MRGQAMPADDAPPLRVGGGRVNRPRRREIGSLR